MKEKCFDKKKVGLLGCTGMVGKGALDFLLGQTESIDIVLAGRSIERMKNAVSEVSKDSSTELSYFVVDVFKDEQLDDLCRQCDLIINCAGPFDLVGDKVLKACVRNNRNCVDASGDETFLKSLSPLSKEAVDKNLSCIISSGINPGLSEIMPAYVMTHEFDHTDNISVFFLGRGALSFNATLDIVNAIIAGNDKGATYSQNGNLSIATDFYKVFDFPEPAGKCMTYPSVSDQFVEMTVGKNVDEAYFYNAYADKSVLFQFMKIKAGAPYETEEKIHQVTRELQATYSPKDGKAFAMIHLLAEGTKDGVSKRITKNCTYFGNGENFTGVISAAIGILQLNNKILKKGIFHASDAVQYNELVKLFENDTRIKILDQGELI